MHIDYKTCCEVIYPAADIYNPTMRPLVLAPEIVGALHGCFTVWLPFVESWYLAGPLHKQGIKSIFCEYDPARVVESAVFRADGLYFGTPTIVNGAVLFNTPAVVCGKAVEDWNAQHERYVVRTLVAFAKKHLKVKKIVSGLGSGDITPEQRIVDMGKTAEVVAWKKFQIKHKEQFEDWVIAMEINQ